MLRSLLLVMIGGVVGALVSMLIEVSQSINYIHRIEYLEKDHRKVLYKNRLIYDENTQLKSKIYKYQELLRTNNIEDTTDD